MSLLNKLAEKALATLGQRGSENGYDKKSSTAQEERSAAQSARVFNELTGHQLSTTDAWTFLQVLKMVRMENQIKTGSGDLLDSCNDMISYSLLKSETALQDYRPVQAGFMVREEPVRVSGDPSTQGYARRTDPRAKPVTGNHPSLTEPTDAPNTTAVRPSR